MSLRVPDALLERGATGNLSDRLGRGAVIDFVASATASQDGMDEEEHRDHIAAVVGELMARTLGITRYREEWRFVDLKA